MQTLYTISNYITMDRLGILEDRLEKLREKYKQATTEVDRRVVCGQAWCIKMSISMVKKKLKTKQLTIDK